MLLRLLTAIRGVLMSRQMHLGININEGRHDAMKKRQNLLMNCLSLILMQS